MDSPFDLPVRKTKKHPLFNPYIVDKADEKLLCMCYEEVEADYIVHVINSHKKLVDALKKYGDHEPGCVKGDACNCGFEQALEAENSNGT